MEEQNTPKKIHDYEPSQFKKGYGLSGGYIVDAEGNHIHPAIRKEYSSWEERNEDYAKYPDENDEDDDENDISAKLNEPKNAFIIDSVASTPIAQKANAISITRVVADVWDAQGRKADFDDHGRLVIDGKATEMFRGKRGNGNYIATEHRDDPIKGNNVSYVAETLNISKTEALKRICDQYKIKYDPKLTVYKEPLQMVPADELCEQEFPSTEWRIERIIPENQITVVSGSPSSYKTMSSMDWAMQVATGGKAFGQFQTTQGNVLLVNEDGDHKRVIKKRTLFLTQIPPNNLFIMSGLGFKAEEEQIRDLADLVKKHSIKFVVLDSFRGIMPPDTDEKDAGAVRKMIDDLRILTNIGATVLILHHDRKKPVQQRGYTSTDPNDLGEMMSGSADIRGAVDCHLAMGSMRDKKENRHIIIVTQTKCREDELLPAFKVVVNTTKDDNGKTTKMELVYEGEYKLDNKAETIEKARAAILDFVSKGTDEYVTRLAIVDSKIGGYGQRTLDEALKTLTVDGSLEAHTGKELGKAKSEGRQKFYRIPNENELLSEKATAVTEQDYDPLNF